jgi:8-oxo-dGTP pyrophosphatase MutT (NUDIX family)
MGWRAVTPSFNSDPAQARFKRLAACFVDHQPEAAPVDLAQAAVAIVLRLDASPDVLLMQRAKREGDRWSGQVSLPGGHVDPEDVDVHACAIRETHEELGLDLASHARPLGRLDAIQARAKGGLLPMWITPVVFVQQRPAELVLSHEATASFRLPFHEVLSGELDAEFAYDQGDATFQLPSWRFEGRTIWGLTHRILSGLIELAGEELASQEPS